MASGTERRRQRGAGEGSVYKRDDGRWCAELYLGRDEQTGKRLSWRVYGDTRREVADALQKAIEKRNLGRPLVVPNQTVQHFLGVWLEKAVKPHRRPATYRGYETNVRVHIVPTLGSLQLAKLTPLHVQSWLNDLKASGLADRTVEYAFGVLRTALNRAVKWGMLASNPVKQVDSPTVEREEVQAFSVDQALSFTEATRRHRLFALFQLALGLGLRQEEALGLRWEAVDLTAKELTVRLTLQRVEGKWELLPPKSPKSRRVLPIPDYLVEALEEHRARQLEERGRAGPAWKESGLVFVTKVGTPLDGSNVTHIFQRLCRHAGLPAIHFHALRHCCGSFLAYRNTPLPVISAILGHAQVSTTANMYLHSDKSLARKAVSEMQSLLGGGQTGRKPSGHRGRAAVPDGEDE